MSSLMMHTAPKVLGACGLGLRREFFEELLSCKTSYLNFLEIAPENWIGLNNESLKMLALYRERYPMVCHGLSLSLGSIAPLNVDFLKRLKTFLKDYQIDHYSEHLSYCSDEKGYLYDLMPMPFTEDAVFYLRDRINHVQDILERQIILENISYYAQPKSEMSESEFINAVLKEANCKLLLDVNNIYVNSVNHHYDPKTFIQQMPTEKIAYIHIAGHWKKTKDLIIDTHGEKVTEEVWKLLEFVYAHHGTIPTLLERDNEIPEFTELLDEVLRINKLKSSYDLKEEA